MSAHAAAAGPAQLPSAHAQSRQIAGGLSLSTSGVANSNSTVFEAFGSEFVDNTAQIPGIEPGGIRVVGGLSMGGYVTLAICRLAPRYVQGLVLADTRAEADTAEGVAGRKKMLATLKASSKAAEELGLPGAERPHFELLDSAQLGLALGIESVIHAAPTQGAAGEAAVKRAERLARYIAN